MKSAHTYNIYVHTVNVVHYTITEGRLSIFVPYYAVNFPDSLTERRCDAPRIAVDGFLTHRPCKDRKLL